MSQECDQPFLEGSEASFYFAFCLRSGSDKVRYADSFECSLELAFWVFVIVGATGSKKAQSIGINDLWQAVCFEGVSEVTEVVPSGVSLDETTSDIEARGIVHSEEQDLFFWCRPPLVDRTIVLPEFPDMSPSKTTINPVFWCEAWNEVWKVFFDIGLHIGSGSGELVEAHHFICYQLKIGRRLQGHKGVEKSDHLLRPAFPVVATARSRAIIGFAPQKIGSQFVESTATDSQIRSRCESIQTPGVECTQCALNEFGGLTVKKLFFFIVSSCLFPVLVDNSISGGSAPKPPEFCALEPMGIASISPKKEPSAMNDSAPRHLPLWRRFPLRVLSSSAVS